MKKSYSNLIDDDEYKMIYLSPDSDNPLQDEDFHRNVCFIIGGLVDETVQSKLSLNKAREEAIATRRLPIEEHMQMPKGTTARPALAINHVGEILFAKLNQDLRQDKSGDWRAL